MADGQGKRSKEAATREDFQQLRVVQLRRLCRGAGLQVAGSKSTLAARLADCSESPYGHEEMLALRQAFGAAAAPAAARAARKRPAAADASGADKVARTSRAAVVGERDLRRLLWALEDGALACERCGGPLLHRNGRFGLFLACGASPPCGQFENLKHASSRLGDDEGPLCITMELEDVCQVRLYAVGARDSACLRAWAAECGLGPEVVAPRDDWVATCSRAVIGAARPGSTLFSCRFPEE
ncbi:unnamed protein product [Prorocentrum cordatum]|uniref:SAP domain-containing protein n=1 Tax=Prorocentrum cordatum TaxID=2364126 RepID=A0ABN9SI88_9DINO|nr:unnamed protein product [Polarella glacialis]